MHVLICGSRRCGKTKEMLDLISSLPEDAIVVTGGADGADRWANKMAGERGLATKVFPAQWVKYGRSAGYRRNVQMLEETFPEQVYCFFVSGAENKGTQMMFNLATDFAKQSGLEVVIKKYEIGY